MKVLSHTDLLNYAMSLNSENLSEHEAIVLAALLAKRDGFTLSMGAHGTFRQANMAVMGIRLTSTKI